ncbi:MAG: OsmC family protein [Deltaproteobacteria bacterium]
MDADALRQLQAPLKARYKEHPADARVTLRARGSVRQATLSCQLEGGKAGVPAGLHQAAGGDGSQACSGDMLLEALVGCAGVTLAAVATAMGIELSQASVTAEGEVDFRGTLGVAKDVPVGFESIRVLFEIRTPTPDKLPKLIELTERYCVVFQTLSKPPRIELRVQQEA